MNKYKFTVIGHRNLSICNPLSSEKVNKAISLLDLKPDDRVIDFGAGKGEILVRTMERYGSRGTAVELQEGLISDFTKISEGRVPTNKISLILKEAKSFLKTDLKEPFDAGFCIGSSHAFGTYIDALEALKKSVITDGLILMGNGYWKQTPAPEFLAFMESNADELGSHESNIVLAESLGLTPLWSCVASEDDWDEYEWQYSRSIEEYVRAHPQDPDSPAMKERIKRWRNATLKWGRDTFGFGLYLFRNS